MTEAGRPASETIRWALQGMCEADRQEMVREIAKPAVAEEREACAQVAEDPEHRWRDSDHTMQSIARAIRSRSEDRGATDQGQQEADAHQHGGPGGMTFEEVVGIPPSQFVGVRARQLRDVIQEMIDAAVAARTEEIIALANTPEFNELSKNVGWAIATVIREKFLPEAEEADHAKP